MDAPSLIEIRSFPVRGMDLCLFDLTLLLMDQISIEFPPSKLNENLILFKQSCSLSFAYEVGMGYERQKDEDLLI